VRRRVLLVVLLVGLASGAITATWRSVRTWLDRPLPLVGPVEVEVAPGLPFRSVVERLTQAGVVDRPELFSLYARWRGQRERVQAGMHVFAPPMTPRDVLERLVAGTPRPEARVTVPEGSNIWQVARRMAAAGVCSEARFLEAAESLEGRLFPDTYRFYPNTPAAEVVEALHSRSRAVLSEVLATHQVSAAALKVTHSLSDDDLVTLASLVEEEARVADERPRIARVFYNRLARGMRLETDPTCVYGATTWQEVPSPARCKDPKNRYSTYVIDGLPPGPISSPGRASLEAVVSPSKRPEDADLLFFVARRDGSGAHHFSATLAEHSRAVRRYLQRRR